MKKSRLLIATTLLWLAFVCSFLGNANTASAAAITAKENGLTLGNDGTVMSLDVVLSPAGFSGNVVLTCVDSNGKIFRSTATPIGGGTTEYLADCRGLTPKTFYNYSVYPDDALSFDTLRGSFTTKSGVGTTTTSNETYKLESSVVVTDLKNGLYDAEAKVDIANPVLSRNYRLGLGATKDGGQTCIFDGTYVSTPRSTVNDLLIIDEKQSLTTGTYCLTVQKQNDTNNGYTTVVPNLAGSMFVIGNPITVQTTTPQGPNAYGCVSTGTDSYCMLAPLPLPDSNGKVDSTGKIDTKQGIGNYFNGLIKLFMGVIGVLAVLMIIVGGIEYMTTVSIGEKEGAKSRIMNALFGLLLALSAYLILRTINPNLVNLAITVPTAELTLNESYAPNPDTYVPSVGTTGSTTTKTDVTTNINTYDALLAAASKANGIECTFAKAIMYKESNGNPKAVSNIKDKNGNIVNHAYGLMQLIPTTYAKVGGVGNVTDMDPANNINAGVKYLAELSSTACSINPHKSCDPKSIKSISAAYNGGPKANAVSNEICAKANPPIDTTAFECPLNSGYAETRTYVKIVQNNYDMLKKNGWGC